MPRIARVAPGGFVYHVLNRANGRLRLFKKEADFLAFQDVLLQAHERHSIRILAWCMMSNHWHFVVWPKRDGELSRFFGYLGLTHAARWQAAHDAVGMGHVYQARFKNFMVQEDGHLLTVLRYVERNPLRRSSQVRGGLAVEQPAHSPSRPGKRCAQCSAIGRSIVPRAGPHW